MSAEPRVSVRGVSKVFQFPREWLQNSALKHSLFARLGGRPPEDQPTCHVALKGIDLEVASGKTCALLGTNGSGKSTLLRLIAGIYRPDAGSIHTNGKIATLFDVGVGFHPEFTGRENVLVNAALLGLPEDSALSRMEEIARFADIGAFLDRPLRSYSSGMLVRLGFAATIHLDPDILLIDEVLAVGDAAFREKCYARLRQLQQRGKTIVLATHDDGFARSCCDQALWLEGGILRLSGPAGQVVSAYNAHLQRADR